ncbi:hypothetical protein M0R88_18330 [Halorussus gelatinilyticus]|uniref:DUF7344 domain-containing protein n=1 Tax=Halorussus gelatinilyticus TaxID=2937524 RepID=A0A8U0IHA0_9EURY|nr:hypothetical protein [Halorussus gelatinilyticus]UPW00447.1 hypothetical protein M0R88_18330 [Halorussus gelatinilyticus]
MDFETAFDLLSNEYRRAIVALLDEEGSVPRERLPRRLLARGVGPDDDRTRRRLRIALHHNHLPRLADAGVLTYDDEAVTATAKVAAVASWLDGSNHTPTTARSDLDEQLTAFYA